MNCLCFHDVVKSYPGKPVLDRLSFSVERGQVYGLLGPNGCGKSTAINILCGLLEADGGSVRLDGTAPGEASHRLGVCPQELALYRDLDAWDNLRFFGQIYGLGRAPRARRVAELVERFGLGPCGRTPVGKLSGGWQRRVSMAVALVHEPAFIVLDEPTSGVDLEARHELWRIIEGLRDEGTTLLLTTHHLDEAERLCSRIGIMREGRLAVEGTLPELLARVPGKLVALLDTGQEGAVTARALELGWGVRHYAGKLACLLPEVLSLQGVVEALAGLELSALTLKAVGLEHAFLEAVR